MGGKATTEIEHKVIRQDWLDGNSIASLSKKYKRDKDTIKETQSCTQTLDLCMLDDRLPSTNEQICGRRIMAITRASQARDVGSIPIARSPSF